MNALSAKQDGVTTETRNGSSILANDQIDTSTPEKNIMSESTEKQPNEPTEPDKGAGVDCRPTPCSAIEKAWEIYHGPMEVEGEEDYIPAVPPVFMRGFVDGYEHAKNQDELLPENLLDVNAVCHQRDELLAENVILRHALNLIADDKDNPEGWASGKQIADHYLEKANSEKPNEESAGTRSVDLT